MIISEHDIPLVIQQINRSKCTKTCAKLHMFHILFISITCMSLKVLHHLGTNANGVDFPAYEEMLGETRRVLGPGGIMIIAEVLPTAVKEAIWYCQLSDSLCERFSKLYPSVKQYLNMFNKYSFKCIAKFNCLGHELQEKYYDPEGPLKEEWRSGSSLFAFATEQEIEEIKLHVQKMKENGTIMEYMMKHDRSLETGLLTILVCISL